MSDRDKQIKQNRDSNMSNSMYDRVNIGSNNANNKFDGPHLMHTGGSMDNPDEKTTTSSSQSFFHLFFYYLIGLMLSIGFIFIGYVMLRDSFFSVGMNQLLPSFLLVVISLGIGFFSSGKIVNAFKK